MKKKISTKYEQGFTLLEVMIAIAIMALSVIVIFQIQGRAINMAGSAKKIITATELAKSKLLDCEEEVLQKSNFLTKFSKEGTFDDTEFEGFKWECHAYRFAMPTPPAALIQQAIAAQSGGDASGLSMQASMFAPFIGLISDTLKESIAELVVIVKWQEENYYDEVKLVTHVVNKRPMMNLIRALPDDIMGGALGGTQKTKKPSTGGKKK